ncbi:MAG: T9SS type A sorting domain-containing protein [Gemmatimonadota bacterium]|nr:T9SS type A sorting domain-containing protein [Gemmatimonadota bacterium]
MKTRTLFTSAYMIPVVGLLALAGAFSDAGSALAQDQGDCVLPPGATPPVEPHTTARDVENGSATLKEFALAAREIFRSQTRIITTLEQATYFGCLVRQEGSAYRSGSTYLIQLTPDGRVFVHSKAMALSGRLLNPLIYGSILSGLGVSPGDLANMASPDPAVAARALGAAMGVLMQEPDGAFDATTPIPGLSPGIPGASGHAAVYVSANFGLPIVLLAGFDLDLSHVAEEEIDYGDPTVAASDVVDRETLKAFVTEAGNYFLEFQKSGDIAAVAKVKIALRDPNGPWRHGPVYLYVLDTVRNVILFHGAFPDRYELRPLVATVRDVVTGELILPQVIAAAKSDPEGGFVEYYFDDPTDDTDSADIPKVGYAREYKGEFDAGGRVLKIDFIVGSGFYGSAPDVVTAGPGTVVEAAVLGDAVEGLDVAFSRAIAGRQSDYTWRTVTDAAGLLSLTISSADGVSGYYRARATNADGEVVGRWSSIPLNVNQRHVLELTLGGGARVVRVEALAASGPDAAAKPAFAAETLPEASGLAPNSPNPFNSATLITYHLSSPGPVKLVIYNVLGQPVRTLVDETRGAGTYHVRWDARDDGGALLSTGVYIAHLSYPGGAQNQRLLYLK